MKQVLAPLTLALATTVGIGQSSETSRVQQMVHMKLDSLGAPCIHRTELVIPANHPHLEALKSFTTCMVSLKIVATDQPKEFLFYEDGQPPQRMRLNDRNSFERISSIGANKKPQP